ncbi:MAG: alpha/beta fold hydrolase [Bacillota bacterium]|nr:alpha/beta fold hydrolase [Bacillota bacterium]
MSDYYKIIDDSPSLLNYLFYPRRQHSKPPDGAYDLNIPVSENVVIVCRAFLSDSKAPWLLFFHGNGEVVSDYDHMAPHYNKAGLNLLVADYRGYGASGGRPTFQNLVNDAYLIYQFVSKEINNQEGLSEWFVMGRSLGSISALELAGRFPDQIKGIIIESGFISVAGLIYHLGLPNPGDLSSLEETYRKMAASIKIPALVIHGSRDRLVPLSQGKVLYQALGSAEKKLVLIPDADHNDIMFVDTVKYIKAVKEFVNTYSDR